MSKQRHKFVFFIEPTDKDGSASTIGNFYLNRIAIDEDASHEIVNINMPEKNHKYQYNQIGEYKEQIGMDQIFFSSIFFVKWGASSRRMTIAKMHSTLCCVVPTVNDSL